MKIIIVSGFFYPTNAPRAFRTTELVKQFVRLGHDLTLYVPKTGDDIKEFLSQYHVSIHYYERKTVCGSKGLFSRIKNRILTQYAEYPDSTIVSELKGKLKKETGYDLLITVAMPHPIHWTVGLLYNEGHKIAKKWVADCGDPYMLCGTNRFKRPFYFKYIEKIWCKHCDYITVPTKEAINGYYPEFRNKIRVIPQAFDFSEVKRKDYHQNPVPTFAFSGNIIPHVRDPRPFLDFLSKIDQKFKFIMYCSKHHMVVPYVEKLQGKLVVKDYIPRLDLLNELSGMDFLINIENATHVQTPSKLIDYALTGRPILSVNPLKLEEKYILRFLKGDYSSRYTVDNIDDYNIVNVANKFIKLALN